jgi:hypothetical protein
VRATDLVDLADQIDAQWLSSKWRDREWRPLVSMTLGWDSTRAPVAVTSTGAAQHASAHHGAGWDSTRAADGTGAAANASERARACLEQPSVIWAGSHRAGLVPGAALPKKDLPNKDLPHQGTSRAEAVRRQLLDAVRAHLVKLDPTAAEWVGNLTVHLDERPTQRAPSRAAESTAPRARASPNAWVVFPTYHGERQKFNGYHCSFPQTCPSGRHEWPHS